MGARAREFPLPEAVRREWDWLARAPSGPVPGFASALVDGLPPPAQRWLTHAIAPGAPLATRLEATMRGQIRVGRWLGLEAQWLLAPPEGFVWAATARLSLLSITGFDRLAHDSGEMRWRLFGRVPFLAATGPDVTRSAAGRLAAEFVFVPPAGLASFVTWEPVDERRAVAVVTIGESVHRVTLTVAPSGALESVTLPRWGNPDNGPHREHLFTALFDSESRFEAYVVPTSVRAGWWQCPDRCASEEFLRFDIAEARYR